MKSATMSKFYAATRVSCSSRRFLRQQKKRQKSIEITSETNEESLIRVNESDSGSGKGRLRRRPAQTSLMAAAAIVEEAENEEDLAAAQSISTVAASIERSVVV